MRRTPSNRMPAYRPPEPSVLGLLVLAGIVLALSLASGGAYFLVFVAAGMLLFPVLLTVNRRVRARRRVAGRQSICAFARSFDVRRTDTWIVRAVFDVLREFRDKPLSASARLEEDLGLDVEDLDELLSIVHQRTGRPFDPFTSPMLSAATVGELVAWFQSLPRQGRAAV